jgi:DNA polymerase III delta prime subunit
MTKKIFLGGTANNSIWREQLIPLLDASKISYFNPVITGRDWTLKDEENETIEKKNCDFMLYTITKEILGFYSIAEVVDDSNKKPEKTIFCYLEEGFGRHQIKSLQATAKLVKENGAKVFTSLKEVVEYLSRKQSEDEWESLVEKAGGKRVVETYFLSQSADRKKKKKKVEIKKFLNFFKKNKTNEDNLSDKLTEKEINRMKQLYEEIKRDNQEQTSTQDQIEILTQR